MATPGHLLLRLSLLLTFLAITATARPGRLFHPCHETLIFFSSSHPLPQNPNPNFLPRDPTTTTISFSSPRSVTFFFTRRINPYPKTHPQIIVDRATTREENHPLLPLVFYSSSFRDRTKDILSVVGSLLLGIGCGGLTAATLYLIWSLFAPNRFDFRGYEDDEESDDDVGPKKMGYVVIPAADVAPAKAADAVAPAKELV